MARRPEGMRTATGQAESRNTGTQLHLKHCLEVMQAQYQN
uniref:Uncharacterized protein n=1 Tax=Setaria viridis TaxID=4556 RepID=A0A4U6UEX1_SETVI|nr:hypothetical protein SEVIR_5G126100v2 [Setaria viridis]